MSKVFTPEKVRDLVDIAVGSYIAHDDSISGIDNAITHLTEWLEQNQPEQFEVNWDDAPKNTHYARLQVEWLNKMNQQTGFSVLSKSERPHPEVKETVVRRSTHPFARAQQFMPDWTNWVDKDGACFWHE